MMSSFHRPPAAGKSSDVDRRVSHWLTLAHAFLALAGFYGQVPERIKPYARRVAAFLLHQATEMFVNGILAPVSIAERRRMRTERPGATGSRGRAHDLGELMHFAERVCPDVGLALPRRPGEDARLFALLSGAYTRARYSKRRFDPSTDDITTLIQRVHALGKVAALSALALDKREA